MRLQERTIEKLIVKHEVLAHRIKYCEMTGKHRKKIGKMRKKLYQTELWISFLAGMAGIRVDWKEEYYRTRNAIQICMQHPYQHYVF